MPFPVTFVLDRLAPSETFIRREIDLLRQRGWPIQVFELQAEPAAPDAAASSACRSSLIRATLGRFASESGRNPAAALRLLKRLPQAERLARLTAAHGGRLLHAHFAGIAADLAGVAAQALGIPWTCSVHAHDVFTGSSGLLRRRLSGAHAVAACSRAAAAAVISAGIPEERVTLIRHGLPLDEYPFVADRPCGHLFTACRLVPKKGLDTLLHACSRLRNRGHRFTCMIAGDGPLREPLERLVDKLNLSSDVRFTGWLSQGDVRDRLTRATALVLPSRRTADGDRDGIANVLVEGLALGTPVITTTAGAASEVVTHARNGWLVEPDNPEQLADAVTALERDPALRSRLALAGRQTAEQEFDGAVNIVRLETLFDQVRCAGT